MTTLDKIKAEIQKVLDKEGDSENARAQALGLMWVLELIDKYAEQEPNRDMKEIAEILKCDANAETKCKMISNILTAKPHYFAEMKGGE